MFAENVTVADEHLQSEGDGPGEFYQRVQCSGCEVEVGARDQDEIFHFFDVVPC